MFKLFQMLLGLICTAALCGCLISHSSHTTQAGVRVSQETFAQIKAGTTTIGWVEQTLGTPSARSKNGDDDVWKYTYTEHTDSNGSIFIIFGGADSTDKIETSYIEFKDDIVINKWRG